jgi:hippurate hydrolase
VIPDEVKLQLTVRSYGDDVRRQALESIKRIARGQALAAGLPDNLLPEVKVYEDYTPALYDDPVITDRLTAVLQGWLGETNLVRKPPSMGGEDFSEFGRTDPKVPITMFNVGGVNPEVVKENKRAGKPLPSLHSPFWAPMPEPTIKTGVITLTACALDLMKAK